MEKYGNNLFTVEAPQVVCEKCVEYQITVKRNDIQAQELNSPDASAKYALQFYCDDISIYESAFIILLNNSLKTIGWAKIAQGGIASTMVDVRLIAKYAIESLACNVVFVHNHPSGRAKPSLADNKLTQRIKEGLALLDVKLVDSIIITPNGEYYSFQQEGMM